MEVFHHLIARFTAMESKGLSNRVVDQGGILNDKRVPRGLIAFHAAGEESFFFFGHPRLCETIEQVIDS